MISLFYLNLNTPNGASKIIADGELELVQQEPIMITSKKKDLYAIDPLDSVDKYSLPEILEHYEARNEKTVYNYQSVIQPFGSSKETSIETYIRIPTNQRVSYIPGLLETLKLGWL